MLSVHHNLMETVMEVLLDKTKHLLKGAALSPTELN